MNVNKKSLAAIIGLAIASQSYAVQISFMGNEKTSREIPIAGAEDNNSNDGDHLFTKNVQVITETREVMKGKCANNKPFVIVFKNGEWDAETPSVSTGKGLPAADVAFEACGEKTPVSKIFVDTAAKPTNKNSAPPPPGVEAAESEATVTAEKNPYGCDTIITTPIACMEKAAKSFKGK